MSREGDVGIGRIRLGQIRDEVVEPAVVRLADKGDAFQEFFRGFGVLVRNAFYECKPINSLRILGQSFVSSVDTK